MPNYYNEHTKFFVSVDCVIFGYSEGSLKLLIHRRPYTPYQGEWSVIGGVSIVSKSLRCIRK